MQSIVMWTFITLLVWLTLCALTSSIDTSSKESEVPVLYYYGLEESERGLPLCAARQACSAYIARYWRPPALVRLCRCARRVRCDFTAPPHSRIDINNRAFFQFCQPVTGWPVCSFEDTPLTVQTNYERMNPDELERLHHRNLQLIPPKIVFKCKCLEPNYWKLNSTADLDETQVYQCSSLPPCKSGEFCGNVNNDLNTLYQSCLCPKHHICVPNGGIPREHISELLYRGKGWEAYCRRISDYSYEDYYE